MASIGYLGHILTTQKFQMLTLLSHNINLEVESVIDILTLLQMLGESGYVHGRRKGVFK